MRSCAAGLERSDPPAREPDPDLRAMRGPWTFPSGISVGVLMMRHCTHFRLYAEKCRAAGAKRIITNARWRMDVEAANLEAERIPYREAGMGWYACLCGAAGFIEGPAEQWSGEEDGVVSEVTDCPKCRSD